MANSLEYNIWDVQPGPTNPAPVVKPTTMLPPAPTQPGPQPTATSHIRTTSAPLPPQQQPTMTTTSMGGNLPALPEVGMYGQDYMIPPTMSTGGNQRPMSLEDMFRAPPMSGNTPPQQQGPVADPRMYALNMQAPTRPDLGGQQVSKGVLGDYGSTEMIKAIAGMFEAGPQRDIGDLVSGHMGRFKPSFEDPTKLTMKAMDELLSSGGSYMTNALRSGMSLANSRGLMNSNMAAGMAQKSAIESSMPILNEIMGLTGSREQAEYQMANNALSQAMNMEGQRESQSFQDRMKRMGAAFDTANMREDHNFKRGENSLDRGLQSYLQESDQWFTGNQNSLDRSHRSWLQSDNQNWQTGENRLQRDHQWGLQKDEQGWKTGENALSRNHDVGLANLNAHNNLTQTRYEGELRARQAQQDYEFRRSLQSDQTAQQDWLNNQDFTRKFNADLSTMPLRNAMDLTTAVQRYAMENPEVYTPEVISGMTNFFSNNMFSVLSQYFPNMIRNAGTNTGTGG